jgi:protein O-GlcNAc transferase
MPHVDAQSVFEEHLRWAARHADPLTPVPPRRALDRAPDRRLKIGYVSPYFRQHAISVFTEPVLAAHDHQHFEILCYSDLKHPDAVSQRFRAAADRWIDTAADSDAQLAERIAAEGVDILVDLTGHLEGSRLLAFARKPAPIQVTYIGYQNTTGMRAMDYRLTDDFADPPGMTDRYYSERLVRLPRAFFCYQPASEAPPVNRLPALDRGRITFGSFNKLAKVTGEVLSTWAQVLAAVPDSRLLILADPSTAAHERVQAVMAAHRVAGQRVEFVAKRPRREYLELHQQVDIALDAFPFNGHTTLCEALWMGVPVVMLAGQTYVSRFGGSALRNLNLEAWIAASTDEYVRTAVDWAGDLERLQSLRGGLRPRMLASPLLDAVGFTRNLEAVYRQLWTSHCAGSSPLA